MASLVLVLVQGNDGGVHFPLHESVTTVGRDHGCDIQVHDESVSRRHFQVVHEAPSPRFVVRDLHSANGVFVNERRIDVDTTLDDGDHIAVGATEFIFLQDDQPSEAAALASARKRALGWRSRKTVRVRPRPGDGGSGEPASGG